MTDLFAEKYGQLRFLNKTFPIKLTRKNNGIDLEKKSIFIAKIKNFFSIIYKYWNIVNLLLYQGFRV